MAIFRKIHVSFWSDPYIQSLPPEQRYFYLYLLTNERTSQCGIYEISKKQISHDTGYDMDTVSILLEYFIKSGKIKISSKTHEIAIKNWKKHNDSRSPQVQVLVNKQIKAVKDKSLIEYIYSMDDVSIDNVQPEQEQEPEREQDQSIKFNKEEKNQKNNSNGINESGADNISGRDALLDFIDSKKQAVIKN